jgi:hypothetical protein
MYYLNINGLDTKFSFLKRFFLNMESQIICDGSLGGLAKIQNDKSLHEFGYTVLLQISKKKLHLKRANLSLKRVYRHLAIPKAREQKSNYPCRLLQK